MILEMSLFSIEMTNEIFIVVVIVLSFLMMMMMIKIPIGKSSKLMIEGMSLGVAAEEGRSEGTEIGIEDLNRFDDAHVDLTDRSEASQGG